LEGADGTITPLRPNDPTLPARRSTHLVTVYVLSLAATFGLLVVWVIYVVRSAARFQAMGNRVGVAPGEVSWILLSVGCVLLFFLIIGLTYQLAQALAASRYARKQEEFISNITHEMKSPLAAIKLHAQTLQQEEVEPAARQRFLGHIVQQADRMGRLVDDVLESSRLLARKRLLDLAPVELARFFEGYFSEARPHAEGRGVALQVRIETSSTVMATEEALRRVMDNLIDNAVRFSPRGGEVRCLVDDDGVVVHIEVEDDGAGIPKKELESIFERFYQAGSESDAHRRGTGLGLSIVAGLVREMRGTVRAFSMDGPRTGSRFVIELPVASEGAR
jgi:signal transduction histidine kinase